MYAIRNNWIEVLEYLLSIRCPIEMNEVYTVAIKFGRNKIIQILIGHHIVPTNKSEYIEMAKKKRYCHIVELLESV